jgi:pimeloyl-ACP methyl ester carboxylesterase
MAKKWLLAVPVILIVSYMAGPSPSEPVYTNNLPAVPANNTALENFVAANESQHHLKPDNEARIIWNDSLHLPTDFAIVYLHGFSASQFEGAPTHRNVAKKIGANLYLSRLAEHGIDTSAPFANLTAEKYWASAKEALAIGKQLGKKVILMGTSTGATNAIQLAAEFPGDVYALVLLSPNIAINDPNAWILNNHWGLQIAQMVMGGPSRESSDQRPIYKQYWNANYRLEGAVALQELLETAMTPATYAKVKQPTLMLYYYKDEKHQDDVVKVSAMLDMFNQLGTPASKKLAIPMPNTGDHVIASTFKSGDAAGVQQQIELFLQSDRIK